MEKYKYQHVVERHSNILIISSPPGLGVSEKHQAILNSALHKGVQVNVIEAGMGNALSNQIPCDAVILISGATDTDKAESGALSKMYPDTFVYRSFAKQGNYSKAYEDHLASREALFEKLIDLLPADSEKDSYIAFRDNLTTTGVSDA